MNTRWFLVVMALIGTTLACNLIPGLPNYTPTFTEVKSVTVNLPSGTGSFTLEVTYITFMGRGEIPEPIICYYVTPTGTMIIGSINPPLDEGEIILTGTLSLSVSDPGVYTATCENNSSTSKASAVFGVTGTGTNQPNEPTPTTQVQPTEPTPTATLPAVTPTFAPITVTGTGTQFYVEEGHNMVNCSVPATFSLTVNGDDSAELVYTTREVDTIIDDSTGRTCSWRPNEYTSSPMSGRADLAGQAVTFNKSENYQECNGMLSFANGVLSGELTCWRGNATPLWKFAMP